VAVVVVRPGTVSPYLHVFAVVGAEEVAPFSGDDLQAEAADGRPLHRRILQRDESGSGIVLPQAKEARVRHTRASPTALHKSHSARTQGSYVGCFEVVQATLGDDTPLSLPGPDAGALLDQEAFALGPDQRTLREQ
jgi:hypothetical protein